jgi:nucleotide-binding universal stress UspA family protein
MKTIYCPTDFSDLSRFALDYALRLAEVLDAKVHVVHAYQLPYTSNVMTNSLMNTLKDSTTRELQEFLKPLQNSSVPVDGHCEWNSVTGALRHLTAENADTMVVMGSHGASGWSELLLGSNAVAVMHTIKVPILIVPKEAVWPHRGMRWLYATDLQDERNPEALAWLRGFVSDLQADLDLAHIQQPGDDNSHANMFLDYAYSAFPESKTHLIVEERVETGIYEAVRRSESEGLVLIERRHHWLKEAFHNRMTQAVAHHNAYPVLILKERM